jgi:putative membrane protein
MTHFHPYRPIVIVTLLIPVIAMAQASGASPSAGASALSAVDRSFVTAAAMGGMTEVEAGKLAAANASAPAVKDFGSHMVDDHTKANDELSGIVKSKGLTPPAALDPTHQKVVDRLQKLHGAAFDRAFMSQMLTDHKKTIALFEKASSSAKDADLKAFATKTTPTLKAHLKMAEQASKASTGGKGPSASG